MLPLAALGPPQPALISKAAWALVGLGEREGSKPQGCLGRFPGTTICPPSFGVAAACPTLAALPEATEGLSDGGAVAL